MAIYLGNTLLTGAASSSGGSSLSETDIFTSSGTWTVPQKVIDEIASEGHAEIGLLMVGGGSVTTAYGNAATRSGEVVSELYQLSESDYDSILVNTTGGAIGATTLPITSTDPSVADDSLIGHTFKVGGAEHTISDNTATQITFTPALASAVATSNINLFPATPTVTVIVGSAGGHSGITRSIDPAHPGTATQNNVGWSVTFTTTSSTQGISPGSRGVTNGAFVQTGGNGGPAVTRVAVTAFPNHPTDGATMTPHSFIITNSGGTPTVAGSNTTYVATWDANDPGFLDSFGFRYQLFGSVRYQTYGTWNGSSWTNTFNNGGFSAGQIGSNSTRSVTVSCQIDYLLTDGVVAAKQALDGTSANYLDFRSNPYSPEGIGGFGRNYPVIPGVTQSNTTYLPTNYGSPSQGGYIQIFY